MALPSLGLSRAHEVLSRAGGWCPFESPGGTRPWRFTLSHLVVYIPSWHNFAGASRQVQEINRQRRTVRDAPWSEVRVVVADNGSAYDVDALLAAGADKVISRPTDFGGDLNIALGFLEPEPSDFLWILSDNDGVSPGALACLAKAFSAEDVDLVVGADGLDEALVISGLAAPGAVGLRIHLGLISAVAYRVTAIAPFVPNALRLSWTGWGQLAVQEAAAQAGSIRNTKLVPLGDLVNISRGDSSAESIERARAAYAHSYFGSGALTYIMAESRQAGAGRGAIHSWWKSQWIYASAYRPKTHDPGIFLTHYPSQIAVRRLVESLIRTGTPLDRLRLLASFAPYWRLGVALRRRGIRIRRWY